MAQNIVFDDGETETRVTYDELPEAVRDSMPDAEDLTRIDSQSIRAMKCNVCNEVYFDVETEDEKYVILEERGGRLDVMHNYWV